MLCSKPKIIAHRGYWASQPKVQQNSIHALQQAQHLKIYASEFDVRMTLDEVLIVHHDEYFQDLKIAETSFFKLQSSMKSLGIRLFTLDEFLEQGKTSPLRLSIELKPPQSSAAKEKMVVKFLEEIKYKRIASQCECISFSISICERLKSLAPELNVEFLGGTLHPSEIKERGLDGMDYHYSLYLQYPEWIKEAKKLGLSTNTWTVDSRRIFRQLSRMGLDKITTNYPQKMMF